jgi:HEPN domain-containing protein
VQPKTHVIADLINLLPSTWFIDIDVVSLIKISKYYVTARYPDMLPDISEESLPKKAETEEAIALARIMLDKARLMIETT